MWVSWIIYFLDHQSIALDVGGWDYILSGPPVYSTICGWVGLYTFWTTSLKHYMWVSWIVYFLDHQSIALYVGELDCILSGPPVYSTRYEWVGLCAALSSLSLYDFLKSMLKSLWISNCPNGELCDAYFCINFPEFCSQFKNFFVFSYVLQQLLFWDLMQGFGFRKCK